MNKCLRVYADLSRVPSQWNDEDLVEWLDYNKKFRFGCALFVNGKHVEGTGNLSEESVEKIEEEIRTSGKS
jgi:hypothetical protein